jgi:hypothetical protein
VGRTGSAIPFTVSQDGKSDMKEVKAQWDEAADVVDKAGGHDPVKIPNDHVEIKGETLTMVFDNQTWIMQKAK